MSVYDPKQTYSRQRLARLAHSTPYRLATEPNRSRPGRSGIDVTPGDIDDLGVEMNVHFEGNNGHDADVTRCRLMTQKDFLALLWRAGVL